MISTAHTAAHLLESHFKTLVNDTVAWKELISEDIVWELPYAPAIGHPLLLNGRKEVESHVSWFLSAVEDFRFHDLRILAGQDNNSAVAQVKAKALIKPTGEIYEQEYVVFLSATEGKIRHLREYFNPVQAAKALSETIRLDD